MIEWMINHLNATLIICRVLMVLGIIYLAKLLYEIHKEDK